jgi:hypothetical protein
MDEDSFSSSLGGSNNSSFFVCIHNGRPWKTSMDFSVLLDDCLLLLAFAPMPSLFIQVSSLFCAAGVVIAFPLLLLAHFHIIHLPYEFYEFLNFLILLLGGTIFLLIIFDND